MVFRQLVVVLLCIIGAQISAQSHPFLRQFNVTKAQESVILTWTLGKGNSCIGIGIFRSIDDINFQRIGEIDGVCGSAEFDQNYSFVDNSPIIGYTNYYYITLGFSGRTEPSVPVFFVPIEDNKVTILPHPVVYGTKLYFKNAANGRHTLRIFNLQGAQVFTCYSDTEYFNLDNLLETYASINAPQVVVYSIVNDANSITHTGKMILAHQF